MVWFVLWEVVVSKYLRQYIMLVKILGLSDYMQGFGLFVFIVVVVLGLCKIKLKNVDIVGIRDIYI